MAVLEPAVYDFCAEWSSSILVCLLRWYGRELGLRIWESTVTLDSNFRGVRVRMRPYGDSEALSHDGFCVQLPILYG